MKKSILIIAILAALVSTAAIATYTYTCEAYSHMGWGIGYSVNPVTACNIALNECAKNTNHHDVCYVSGGAY